jgi:folate-dependent phosphoribosylglycinamide formyltransferase PurN
VLGGYAKRVGPLTIAAFDGRMLNVHPAPLPKFDGQGMYGTQGLDEHLTPRTMVSTLDSWTT